MNNNQKILNIKVSKQVSEMTTNLRQKMDTTNDFEEQFQKMFQDIANPTKKLAKDELYYSIKEEVESKVKDAGKKKKKEKKNEGANLLPPLHSDKITEINLQNNKQDAAGIVADMERNPKKYPPQVKLKEPTLVTQINKQKMAFQGNFEKLDDEIKVQVKAIQKNDMETMRKVHAQEMTAEDCNFYLMDDKKIAELQKEADDEYDQDLDRTMYQEFWSEIRKFKKIDKANTTRKSKSTMAGSMSPYTPGSPMVSAHSYGTTPKGIAGSIGAGLMDPNFTHNLINHDASLLP